MSNLFKKIKTSRVPSQDKFEYSSREIYTGTTNKFGLLFHFFIMIFIKKIKFIEDTIPPLAFLQYVIKI